MQRVANFAIKALNSLSLILKLMTPKRRTLKLITKLLQAQPQIKQFVFLPLLNRLQNVISPIVNPAIPMIVKVVRSAKRTILYSWTRILRKIAVNLSA